MSPRGPDVVQHLPGSRGAADRTLVFSDVSSAEFSVVLKVDNRIVGRTHWRQLGAEPWDQSFSTELERVSTLRSEPGSGCPKR